MGGVSGAVSKTLTAPIERVKLVVQTQDANPKIRSGEVPRYTGMVDCAQRILKEQGLYRFWDGNFTNCLRYFPTQAFNLAFKDTFKKMFPKYNPKTEFWKFFGANLVSGGLAAAASMTIVYPLDYARTRLASDVGSGKATFSGLGDCIMKTAKGPGGFFALYTGFGVSVCGIIGYRGLQLGTFDTITGLNPWKKDPGFLGALTTFGAAQTAITIGAGATYPFDTVRRRLQMQSEKPVEEHIYKGTVDCFKKIAAEEGQPLRNFCLPDSPPTLATVVILADSSELLMLRKPASWIVAVCEQSEYKGVWGEGLPKWAKISLLLGGKGVFWERFSGSCTMRQKGDGRVSIPPRSAFWGAFWGAWQRSRCLREGGRRASTDRKGKGKGAFCHCCRCWWRKDKSRPARGSLSGTVMSDGKVFA